jgi:trans-aconitate methyltransferase
MKWDTSLYDQKHSFVTKYGEGVLELLAPKAGERILDLGCGTGHLTAQIAEAGAEVIGLDSSPEMIGEARAAYPNIEFVVADAADFSFDRPFDAIFSNAALHWVHAAEAAVVCMARALKPGGRLVVEFGGKGNVQKIYRTLEEIVAETIGRRVSAQNYFPSVSEYSGLLERHGLEVRSAWLFDRLTRLEEGEDGLEAWIMMFRRPVVESIPLALKTQVMEQIKTRLRNDLFLDGAWHADYRRLRIVACKD